MTSVVPFNDLSRLPEDLRSEIRLLVSDLSVSGKYILGEHVTGIENELASYLGTKRVIGVASGTDALMLAFTALDVVSGDVVLTTANAGAYSTVAAKALGAEPVFVDVSGENLQMTVDSLHSSLKSCEGLGIRPKVLVITHLYGQLNPETESLLALAREKSIRVVEDCAESIGARNSQGMAGTFGDLATFSFYPTKNLGASGDGGAIATNNLQLADKLVKLRQYGWSKKYHIEVDGGRNSRLDEIQAVVLRKKLSRLETWNAKRRGIFGRYIESASDSVKFFSEPDESFVCHLVVISVKEMSRVKAELMFAEAGVQTSRHFPVPDHRQGLKLKYRNLVALPETEWASENCFSIPLFPELREDEILRIEKVLAGMGEIS